MTEQYLCDLDCADETFAVVTPILSDQDRVRTRELDTLAQRLKLAAERPKADKTQIISAVEALGGLLSRLARADLMFRRNAVVQLVSRLDEFVAQALKVVFLACPERLKGRAKALPYDEVLDAASIEEILGRFVDEEVDALLHESQEKHIGDLDEGFRLGIREHFSRWPRFLEVAARRNLFVHAGGVVSREYLKTCERIGVLVEPGFAVGMPLTVTDAYYAEASDAFFEVGLRIGQGLLRRVFPEELEGADTVLVNQGIDLLRQQRYSRAGVLFDYALGLPAKMVSSEAAHRIFVIDRVIAHNWGGEPEKGRRLLESVDWTAASARFIMAVHVLRDEFDDAASVMRAVPVTEVSEHSYLTWPLFRDFRGSEQFAHAFEDVFRKKYTPEMMIDATSGSRDAGPGDDRPEEGPATAPLGELEAPVP